jgi:ABC-type multidrug transport system permease subunit
MLAVAREDLRLTLRDKSAVFWIFIAPFMWVFFFSFVNQPSDPAKTRIGLIVIRHDPSPLAQRLIDLLGHENFTLTVVEPGERPPAGDDAPARTLTIPGRFAEAVAKREKVTLDLREERRAGPEGTFAVQVALHKAIVRLLVGEAFGDLDPASDVVRVRASWGGGRNIPSGLYQTVPGNLVMFVLISTMTYGAGLLSEERKKGILRRLAASPMTRTELLAGKLAGPCLIASAQVCVFILMSATVFRVDWGRSPAGLIAVLASFILGAAALGLLGGSLFASGDAAAGFGLVLVLAMSALGGCWWPSEVMPDAPRKAGHAFPAAWAMDGLHQILSWGGGLRDVLLPCAVLLAFAAAATALAMRLIKLSA